MSISVTTDIHCDVMGCNAWTSGVTDIRVKRVLAEKEAKAAGWVVRKDGLHICPKCKKKHA